MTDQLQIVCPHCGFTKETAASSIPAGVVRVTCPRCRQGFPLEREPAPEQPPPAAAEPVAGVLPEAPAEAGVPPLPEPEPAAAQEEPAEAEPPPAPPRAGGDRLSPFGEIFSRTWEIYKNRIGTLIVLYFICIVLFVMPVAIFLGIGLLAAIGAPESRTVFLAGGGLAGALVGCCAVFWGVGGLISAVADQRLGIREALEQGWERYLPYCWLFTLEGFITLGGYLLFIIPGVIFTVWFIFAKYLVAVSEERGMGALLISREYVRGYWFEVFGRLILVWILSALVGSIPFVGGILSLLFVPFSMIFSMLLFEELRGIKGKVSPAGGTGEKFWIVMIGALGYLLLPFIVIAVAGASLLHFLFNMVGNP